MGEAHTRGISTTLSLLDKRLCEFKEWGTGKEILSVLYEIQNPLSPYQRLQILDLVDEMWDMLRELKDALDLEKTVRSTDRIILGSCSSTWVALSELEGRHLRRYGDVPPGLAEYLDPRMAVLSKKLGLIAEMAARRG